MPVVFGEGAVASLWAAALLTMALWIVCLGLRFAWQRTFGVVFYWLGSVLRLDVSFIHWHPGNYFIRASDAIANSLEHAAASCENTAGRLFHGAAVTQAWVAHEVAQLGRDVYGWANWLQRSHLPRWVKAIIYALVPPLVLPAVVKALGKLNVHSIVRRMKIVETTITQRVVHVVKTVGAVAIPGAWALPGLIPRVKELWRERTQIGKRLKRLERIVGAGAAVALFTAAIARLGLQWIRCRNVSKVGRAVCRTDTSWLDSLLGDALVIVGAISVVEFAEGLLAIESEAVKILGAGIREFPRT